MQPFHGGSSGIVLRAFLVILSFVPWARSQEMDFSDPVSAYNGAVRAVQLENWDEALKWCDGVIAEFESEAMDRFGPVFGHFHFMRGLSLLGKQDMAGATAAFRTCYEKYSNKILETGTNEETQGLLPNLFRNAALVQWGNAEMKLEKFEAARDLYEKVLVEGKDDSKVNLVFVGVNLGRCYLRAGQLEKGYEFMVRPLSNESLSDGLRETIYMIIAEDWTPEVGYAEARRFVEQFSEVVDADPFLDRYERNERFQYLAQLALQQGEPIRALSWYERMVNPRLLVPDFEQRYDSLRNRIVAQEFEDKKKAVLADLRNQIDGFDAGYLQILNGVGSAHFMMQNFAGSFVAFSRLSDQAGKGHAERPVFLHNAVVSAAQIERWRDAYTYGRQFLDEFPGHELRPDVARVLVEILFLREEFEEAYKVSGEVRQEMKEGEKIRDIPDFVYGASAFHLGEMEEAEQELSTYFRVHEQGERKEMVNFFLGLTKVQLKKWQEAAEILNGFLGTYPNSALVPTVLYQCALSEFMLDRSEDAFAKVVRVHDEFPSHEVAPACWNLRGDIAVAKESPYEEILNCYEKGREGGIKFDQPETTAYALWQLLIQKVDREAWEEAEGIYREFREGYSESGYRFDVLVTALPVLIEKGRTDEGLEQLREVVWENREDPNSTVLAEMFGSYVDYLKENYEPEKLREELMELQDRVGSSVPLQGWILVALIDALEAAEAPRDEIDRLFYRLETGFDPSMHSNYPAVRLARWISQVRRKPEEAKTIYDYILENRPGTANYEYCLVDLAEIQAASEDASQRGEAMEKFQRVLNQVPNEELREKSVLGMARIRTKEEKWAEAEVLWEQYLEDRGWTLSRPEANFQLAYCLERQEKIADALKIYVSVYANFPGHLDWSTRAYLRTAAITKAGEDGDLKALKVLQDMLKRMGHLDHPGVEKGKELFKEWRNDYAASQGGKQE